MALTMFALGDSGWTDVVFVRRRRSDGAYWNTSGMPAFEAYNAAHIANYAIAGPETGASGQYTAADPAPDTEGDYLATRKAAGSGGNLAVSDLPLAFWQDWTGPRSANAVQVAGTAQTAGDIIGRTIATTGTVQASPPPTTTSFKTDVVTTGSPWADALVVFTSGALAKQSRPLSSQATNGQFSFDEAFPAAPSAGDTFEVRVAHIHTKSQIAAEVLSEAAAAPIAASVMQWAGDGAGIAVDVNHLPKVDAEDWKGAAAPAMTGDSFARLGAPAGASVSADIAAVKSETDTILADVNTGGGAIYARLGAPGGASIAADIAALPTAAATADKLIGRNIKGGSDGGRTFGQALASIRNRVAFDVPVAGQFTVFDTDDVTPLWVGTYTASAGAYPVTAIDPS